MATLILPPRAYIHSVMMARSKEIQKMDLKLEQRKGDWICTKTGIRFYPLDPRPSEVSFEDIAHALALKTRWGGHCSRFYSVATHSLRVADVAVVNYCKEYGPLSREHRTNLGYVELFALLHDAHEAYLADVPRPLKPHLDWKRHEEAVDRAIFGAMGLAWLPTISGWAAFVKRADSVLLRIEAEELFDPARAKLEEWGCSGVEPAPWERAAAALSSNLEDPHDPYEESQRFLARLHDLGARVTRRRIEDM